MPPLTEVTDPKGSRRLPSLVFTIRVATRARSSCGTSATSRTRPQRLPAHLPPVVHVHFHDYELLDAKRRAAVYLTLGLLARRRQPVELGSLQAEREVPWSDVCAG